jgi:hypothetical protein
MRGQAGMPVLLSVRCDVNLSEPEGERQASETEGRGRSTKSHETTRRNGASRRLPTALSHLIDEIRHRSE